jgi:hypothetical protein
MIKRGVPIIARRMTPRKANNSINDPPSEYSHP